MFRLKALRLENGLKRSDFSKEIELPASTIANYENETRQAPYNLLIRFADYFNVSIDYLLGKENDEIVFNKSSGLGNGLLTNNEKEIIKNYRNSSFIGQERILEYSKFWVSKK